MKEREGDSKGRGQAGMWTNEGEMREGGHLWALELVVTKKGEEHSKAFEEWAQVHLGVIDEEGEIAGEVGGLQQLAPQ